MQQCTRGFLFFIDRAVKPRLSVLAGTAQRQSRLRSSSFCEDARGRWYLNVTVDVKKPAASTGTSSVGIDLGLKDFATLSNGEKVEAQKIYRGAEDKLALAQRANNKQRAKAIHAQIANRRKNFLHKLSTELVKNNGAIFVGDLNAAGLTKTKMAKSVLDAGWSAFRTMLKYKCDNAAVWFDEVNESYSTQECCACHARTGPKGLADLSVRQWVCSGCGVQHDRDTNAAKNILARGLALMEISIEGEARAVEAAMNEAVGGGGRKHHRRGRTWPSGCRNPLPSRLGDLQGEDVNDVHGVHARRVKSGAGRSRLGSWFCIRAA